MCKNFFAPPVEKAGVAPPPISPPPETQDGLPNPIDLADKDEVDATVNYGSRRESSIADANRTGADALRIPLNVDEQQGGQGLNV